MATKTDPRESQHGEEEETPLYGPGSDNYEQTIPAGDASDPRGDYSPHTTPLGDASDPRGPNVASPKELANSEANPGLPSRGGTAPEEQNSKDKDVIGSGFNAANKFLPPQAKAILLFKNLFKGKGRNKNVAITGGVGGLAGLLLVFFMSLAPLKIEFMVENAQNRFFAASEEAVKDISRHLLIKYMVQRALPGYKSCGTTKSLKCASHVATNKNPVSSLFNVWSEQRLENKLATKYGIEFKYDTASNTWKLKAPGADDVDIGRNGEGLSFYAENAERNAFRNVADSAVRAETKWYQTWLRYRVGRLLEKKYGVKRCMIFCGARDQIADFGDDKKRVAKLYLAERVIIPRTETLGIVLSCLFDSSCDPDKTEPTAQDDGRNGAPEAEYETEVRTMLEQRAATYGKTDPESIEKMKKDYKTIQDKGYAKFGIEKIFTKLGFEKAGSVAAGAVPIAGWIVAGSQIISVMYDVGPAVKKLSYTTNVAAAVGVFSMYRSYSDEIHTGTVDPEEVGSFSQSFDGGDTGGENDPIVGGTAAAEESPLYEKWILEDGASTNVSWLNPFSTTAYAQGNPSNYVCADGNSVPQGKSVCKEEEIGGGDNAFSAVRDFLDLPGINIITQAANGITDAVNALVGPLVGLFSSIPGVSDVASLVSSVFNPIFEKIINEVVANPFSTNMSGGRNYHMMTAGADAAGNDACHNGLGCREATSTEINGLRDAYFADKKSEFMEKPFFARMFDTSSQYSLTSKVALSTPSNFSTSVSNLFSNIFSDPLKAILGLFGAFSSPASAADTEEEDPFGIPQYIFPKGDIPKDPEAYWDEKNCDDTSENGPTYKWNKQAADGPTDERSGMPVNTQTNPCLLISTAVASLGGYHDTSLLSEDDKKVYESGGGAASTSGFQIEKIDNPLNSPGGSIEPKGITLHWWAGRSNGRGINALVDALRSNPTCGNGGCSTQIGITADGKVYQLTNRLTDLTYHAAGANSTTFGIEIEGLPEDFGREGIEKYPEKFEAVVATVKYLMEKYDIELDESNRAKCGDAFGIHSHKYYQPCNAGKTDIDDYYFNEVIKRVKE